jgi:hypothetical protein
MSAPAAHESSDARDESYPAAAREFVDIEHATHDAFLHTITAAGPNPEREAYVRAYTHHLRDTIGERLRGRRKTYARWCALTHHLRTGTHHLHDIVEILMLEACEFDDLGQLPTPSELRALLVGGTVDDPDTQTAFDTLWTAVRAIATHTQKRDYVDLAKYAVRLVENTLMIGLARRRLTRDVKHTVTVMMQAMCDVAWPPTEAERREAAATLASRAFRQQRLAELAARAIRMSDSEMAHELALLVADIDEDAKRRKP